MKLRISYKNCCFLIYVLNWVLFHIKYIKNDDEMRFLGNTVNK